MKIFLVCSLLLLTSCTLTKTQETAVPKKLKPEVVTDTGNLSVAENQTGGTITRP